MARFALRRLATGHVGTGRIGTGRRPRRWWLVALLSALVVVVTAAPVTAASMPTVVGTTVVGPRLLDLAVRSPAMGGRTLSVRLLTPVGWTPESARQRSWPTLWLLHGCCSDYTVWSTGTSIAERPELRDVLVVMPEGGVDGRYSDWWDGGGRTEENWETFHLDELRPLLERDYGAGERRVIAGLSMGGHGALIYTARHPGMFAAVAAFSAPVHPLQSAYSIERLQRHFEKRGIARDRIWGDPVRHRDIWEAHDPVYLADRLVDVPVYLSCGDGLAGPYDPPATVDTLESHFLAQNTALAAELRRRGARSLTTHFYGAGQHRWAYWDRELRAALPMLRAGLGLPAVPAA